jgi:hypothetical protein
MHPRTLLPHGTCRAAPYTHARVSTSLWGEGKEGNGEGRGNRERDARGVERSSHLRAETRSEFCMSALSATLSIQRMANELFMSCSVSESVYWSEDDGDAGGSRE